MPNFGEIKKHYIHCMFRRKIKRQLYRQLLRNIWKIAKLRNKFTVQGESVGQTPGLD